MGGQSNDNNKIKGIILLVTMMLFGCASVTSKNSVIGENDYVENGFKINNENSEITPWLCIATKTKKEQETNVNVLVYAGYSKGFMNKWNENVFGSNPGYGKFSLQRIIMDRNNNEILKSFYDLPSFADENKYEVSVHSEEGTDKVKCLDFKYNLEDACSLDEIAINQGIIMYNFCLRDENNSIIKNDFNCGVSTGYLNFEKINNKIMFSNF